MRHISQLALAAMSVLALAGCGGSSSTSSRESTAAFTAQANGICKKVNAEVAALPAMTTEADLFKTGAKEISLSLATIAQLRALKPPSAMQATFDRYLSLLTQETSIVQKALAAIKAGNNTQAKALAAQGESLDTTSHADAKSLHLPACTAEAQTGSASSASSSG